MEQNINSQIETPVLAPSQVLPSVNVPAMPASSFPKKASRGKTVDDHLQFKLIRYPKYEYQTGTTMFLSKRQRIVVDAYLKTGNEVETTRILNEIIDAHGGGHHYCKKAVHKWLQKPHVAQEIAREWMKHGKANWLDEPGWKAWGADVMNGVIKATTVMGSVWKEYGKSQGWYKEQAPSMQFNQQINFVQSDGKI